MRQLVLLLTLILLLLPKGGGVTVFDGGGQEQNQQQQQQQQQHCQKHNHHKYHLQQQKHHYVQHQQQQHQQQQQLEHLQQKFHYEQQQQKQQKHQPQYQHQYQKHLQQQQQQQQYLAYRRSFKRSTSNQDCPALKHPFYEHHHSHNYADNNDNYAKLSLPDKMLLSPLVMQAKLVSRSSSSYNGLFFASFKVIKVLKGQLPKKMRRHIRLVFRRPDGTKRRKTSSHKHLLPDGTFCDFPPRLKLTSRSAGKKFVVFARFLDEVARLAAVAEPAAWGRVTKRAARKTFCRGCAQTPRVHLSASGPPGFATLSDRRTGPLEPGSHLKLRCRVTGGNPSPQIEWFHNGVRVRTEDNFRTRIRDKKATNVLGQHTQFVSIKVRYSAPRTPDPGSSRCPISSFCLNGGSCIYYDFLGELVCRCRDGFAGQRCQFKKASIDIPHVQSEACGPYGHDIHFREICAAWKSPPVEEMTKIEWDEWREVERKVTALRLQKEQESIRRFRNGQTINNNNNNNNNSPNIQAMALTSENHNLEDKEANP